MCSKHYDEGYSCRFTIVDCCFVLFLFTILQDGFVFWMNVLVWMDVWMDGVVSFFFSSSWTCLAHI